MGLSLGSHGSLRLSHRDPENLASSATTVAQMLAAFRRIQPVASILSASRGVCLRNSSLVATQWCLHSSLSPAEGTSSTHGNHGIKRSYTSSRLLRTVRRQDGWGSFDDVPSRSIAQLTTKRRLRDILIATRSLQATPDNFSFPINGTVREAISRLAGKKEYGASMVVDDNGAVAGMFTARDIIKFLYDNLTTKNLGKALDKKIVELYTPKRYKFEQAADFTPIVESLKLTVVTPA